MLKMQLTPNLKIIQSAQDIYYNDQLYQLSKQNVTKDFNRRYPNYNPYNNRVIKFIEYPSDYPQAGLNWIGQVGTDDAIYIDKSFAQKDPEFWPENLLIHEGGGHGLSEDLFQPGGYLRTDNNLATLKVLGNMGKGFYKAHPLEARDVRLTPQELRYAEKAIPLSKEYLKEIDCEIPLEEAARTGYDARIYLSQQNGNILGKELDDKINNLTLEEAMTLLNNTSGYGQNAIQQVKKMSPTQQKEWLENFKKLMYYSIGSSTGIAVGLDKVDKKQKGGPIVKDSWYTPKQPTSQNIGLDGMIKATIGEQYGLFNNPTARRLVGADNRMYVGKPGELGPEGNEIGNVYLGSADNWVFPQIQDVNGELQFIPYDQLYTRNNEGRTDSQSFKMRTPEEAQYFGEHYKEVLHNPMFYNEYSPIKKLYFK